MFELNQTPVEYRNNMLLQLQCFIFYMIIYTMLYNMRYAFTNMLYSMLYSIGYVLCPIWLIELFLYDDLYDALYYIGFIEIICYDNTLILMLKRGKKFQMQKHYLYFVTFNFKFTRRCFRTSRVWNSARILPSIFLRCFIKN